MDFHMRQELVQKLVRRMIMQRLHSCCYVFSVLVRVNESKIRTKSICKCNVAAGKLHFVYLFLKFFPDFFYLAFQYFFCKVDQCNMAAKFFHRFHTMRG